jgi:hypothetical protein
VPPMVFLGRPAGRPNSAPRSRRVGEGLRPKVRVPPGDVSPSSVLDVTCFRSASHPVQCRQDGQNRCRGPTGPRLAKTAADTCGYVVLCAGGAPGPSMTVHAFLWTCLTAAGVRYLRGMSRVHLQADSLRE